MESGAESGAESGKDGKATMLTTTLKRSHKARVSQDTAERLFTRSSLAYAGGLFLGAILVFVLLDLAFGIDPLAPSTNPYFTYQAWSWLHGRWDIDVPGDKTDLITLNGKLYSIYSPFPAVVMLPFVAILGLNASDTLVNLVIGAFNLSLLFLIFEQLRLNGLTSRDTRENAVWAALLYLGSAALYLSLGGTVWWMAHIVALCCTLLALLLALRRHFVWASVALGCAFLTRSPLLLGFPFLLYLAWDHAGTDQSLKHFALSLWRRRPDWRQVPWGRLAAICGVAVGAVVVYLARNWAQFGSPAESGYDILNAQHYPFVTHGLFNIRYLPANLINSFFNFPHIIFPSTYSYKPMIDMMNGGTGISVFLTTPLFLLLFWRNRVRSELRMALWAAIALMATFVLFYYTAGYLEFGTRYLFDIYPFVWVLLVLQEVRLDWRVVALGAIAIFINFLGARQFWTHHLINLARLHLHL